MEVHSMRLDHGPVQTNNMSYPQRQPTSHRPNHSQATHSAADLYKPSRSPLSNTRCPFPVSPQLQAAPSNISQVSVSQRYPSQGPIVSSPAPPLLSGVYREFRQNRISLLHPEYGPGRPRDGGTQTIQAGVVCVDGGLQGGQQPLKKIRLQDKDGIQPLRIDTRPGAYNPQVEAISPTLPEQSAQEDQAFRTTKDELIQQIGKVDREIAKVESQIGILKKKQAELEEIALKPTVKPEVEEDTQPKHQSLPQKIYAENRKKAQSAHAQLEPLGPKLEWPLYNQPSDTSVYHENKRKNMGFKSRLLDYFKKRHTDKHRRNTEVTDSYSKLMQEWLRKVDKVESSTKRKVKDAKNREFFEKVFPELRKQREDKERFNRVGSRVKSEADMEEIMDNLQEQAMEDKKMRSYAVIPPILFDTREQKIRYENNNGFIEDMEAVYKSRQFLNVWTPVEKDIFKDKYLLHPKNFGIIASYLDRKSVSDCVQYYYLSKKTENYKQLLRKNRKDRTRTRSNQPKVVSNTNSSVIDILTTGVTTRLQREQQQRTGQQPTRNDSSSTGPSDSICNVSSTPPPSTTSAATSPSAASGNTAVAGLSSCPAGSTTTPTSSSCNTNSSNNANTNSTPNSNIVNNSNTNFVSSSGTVVTSSTNGIFPSTVVNPTVSVVTVTSSTSVISSICSTTNSTVVTNSSSLENNRQSDVQTDINNASADENKPKFSDFNSFEDYNRKKFFNDESSGDLKDGTDVVNNSVKNAAGGGNVVIDGVTTATVQTIKKEVESSHDNVSDQNNTTTTPLTENKKKKERRKDKEATAMETSDEEAATFQEKTIQGNCAVCNAQLGPQLHSRPLQPNLASQYGIREDQVTSTSRVCNGCRCKFVRSRSTHCPLPSCPNSRGRVKRLRSFPYRLQELPADVRDPILAEFRIPSGVTKCCSACFNRIQRRLGPVEEWPEEDINKLKSALAELGANWQAVGEKLNRLAHTVRCFYAANKKRLNLESCLGDRKPALTDEEESGSSTSSCEEPIRDRERHSSDTASAAESPPVSQGQNQNPAKKEDYDSSATETADEAQTPDQYQAATITPITNDCQGRQNASPMSVKDLVTNVIELSLKNNPSGQQTTPNMSISCMTPTISSILNTNSDLNEVTIVSEYNLNNMTGQQMPTQQQQQQIFAKLVSPMIGATITPVSGPIQTQPEPIPAGRDDLVVVQVPGSVEPETLDLSIKKPRELPPPKHSQQQQQIHHSEPYMYHQERKSPAFMRSQQAKLPSPQPANPKTGSITLGTPIVNQPRYDGGLLRQIPEAKMGSITKGTPIHLPHNVQTDKRMYEYYSKQGRLPQQQQAQQQQQSGQQPPQQQQYPGQYRQPTAYIPEQQLSSRQIIINDYITSKQMLGRRPENPQYYPGPGPQRTPPPSQQSQQRQGVIQRHTRPQYLHSGTDALSSLANVAVQQPSLPVPSAPHEGLGKTMADNIMEQPHRFQIIQQHQQQMRQQQRMEEHRRAYHQQQQQQQQHQQQQVQQARQQARASDSSITAATLIDAIITHQINQTAEGGRGGEVAPSQREPQRAGDLLFQGFHREPPGQGPDGSVNGERPSSVISVDLDSDGINKNLTVKELTDSVISHDFGARPGAYYHLQDNVNEQWKRRLQQQQREQHQKEENKRSATPQQQQDERQIIRIAQPQKYHVEPVSPPENNHWSEQNYRRYQQQQQSHMSPLDYVKNRIVEVMRTEDDNKDKQDAHAQDKDRSDSPGDMVIDEEKHDNEQQNLAQQHVAQHQQQQQGGFAYAYVHKDAANDNSRNNEPKPLLSAQYEPLSDED